MDLIIIRLVFYFCSSLRLPNILQSAFGLGWFSCLDFGWCRAQGIGAIIVVV